MAKYQGREATFDTSFVNNDRAGQPRSEQSLKFEGPDFDYADNSDGSMARTITAIILLVIALGCLAGGMSWWIHPGAGIAILGAALFIVALLVGNQ